MKIRHISAALLIAVPTIATAQDGPSYVCNNADLQRRVQVIYEPGVTVPCEVHYYKDTEAPGESQVLWRALNEEGYCEAKAAEFASKLEGWGWDCNEGAVPASAPAEADDTDDLAPSADDDEPGES